MQWIDKAKTQKPTAKESCYSCGEIDLVLNNLQIFRRIEILNA